MPLKRLETSLYGPVKHYLEMLSFTVKGEVCSCDLVALRQQALACAASLAECPRRTSELRSVVPNAPNILLRNVYGWFTRIERGLYDLTPEGATALARWAPKALTQRAASDFRE